MKFRDRKHCQAVQLAEKNDAAAQALVREFCDLINFPYQQQQGLFAHGYYQAVIDPIRARPGSLAYHGAADGERDARNTIKGAASRIAAGLPDAPHSIDPPPGASDDDEPSGEASRIAAGLPDAPHSIDGPPSESHDADGLDELLALSPNHQDEAAAQSPHDTISDAPKKDYNTELDDPSDANDGVPHAGRGE